MTVEMTPEYWQAARAIAQDLSTTETDINELKKIVSYLCWLRNRQGSLDSNHLFQYLATLTQHGEVRSNQTSEYYKTIAQVCQTHLRPLQANGEALTQILGWAARLHSKA